MKIEMRPYQQEAMRQTLEGWQGGQISRGVIAPTGAGKTVIMTELASAIMREGGRILLVAHRTELVDQAERTLKVVGVNIGREQGKLSAKSTDRIVVSTVQTMARRASRFRFDSFSHVFIDEAHHIAADTYQKMIEFFSAARVLGVTATPTPGTYEHLPDVYRITRGQLEREGYLARPELVPVNLRLDLRDVKFERGEYDAEGVGSRIEPYLDEFCIQLGELTNGDPGIVFFPLVATSRAFRDIAADHGIKVEHVDGTFTHAEREKAYGRVRDGRSQILSNANLLTEGFDLPALRWVCLLRPVLSPVYYEQAVGRAARIAPGKDTFKILDPLMLSNHHVLGGQEFVAATSGDFEDRGEGNPFVEVDPEETRRQKEAMLAEKLQERERVANTAGSFAEVVQRRPEDRRTDIERRHVNLLKTRKFEMARKVMGWPRVETNEQAARIAALIRRRDKVSLASVCQLAFLHRDIMAAKASGNLEEDEALDLLRRLRSMSAKEAKEVSAQMRSAKLRVRLNDTMEDYEEV